LTFESQFLKDLDRRAQLPLAAIHDQEIRQQRKSQIGFVTRLVFFLLFCDIARKASFEHFSHGGKIIRLADRFYVETPIILLCRYTLFEDNHAADTGSALGVGNVVAFDPVWDFSHAQNRLNFSQSLMLAVFVSLPANFEGFERLAGVFCCHLDQFFTLTPLGNSELDLFTSTASVEPLLDDAGFFYLLREHDLVGNAGCLRVELFEEFFENLGVFFRFSPFEDEVLPSDQLPGADKEHLHAGFALGARHGNHVGIISFI